VLTNFQGMPASSIEKTVTNRIERWVNQSPGVRKIESKSVPGVSVVRLYFRDDIDPNGALTLTNSLALGTLPTLPPNTLPPVVLPFDPTGTLPLGILTASNPGLDEAHVKDLARIDVRNMLGSVAGCVAPVVVGGNALAVAEGVKKKLAEMEESLPPGTRLSFVMDQSVYVREAIKSLIHEGVIGAVLVSIMILVFLGNARMTLIASMSIPLAILCSVIG